MGIHWFLEAQYVRIKPHSVIPCSVNNPLKVYKLLLLTYHKFYYKYKIYKNCRKVSGYSPLSGCDLDLLKRLRFSPSTALSSSGGPKTRTKVRYPQASRWRQASMPIDCPIDDSKQEKRPLCSFKNIPRVFECVERCS